VARGGKKKTRVVSIMTGQRSKNRTGVGLLTAEPLGRVAGSTLSGRHHAHARIHRHTRTLARGKVRMARRRLAAGRYDSEEILDGLLEKILKDLTS